MRRRRKPGVTRSLTPPSVIFLRHIPGELKRQFKAYCVRRGLSMTQMFIRFMTDTVAEESRNEVPRRSRHS